MKLSKEKLDWLLYIGAIEERRNDLQYYVPSTDMYYSEWYIEKTPLEELKVKHERNLAFMKKD